MTHHFLTPVLTVLLSIHCLASCTISGDDTDEYGSGLLAEGTSAPDFMIYTDSLPAGFSLSSLQGQYVLIEFWASWCPDCQKATATLRQLHATYAPLGVVFVGVSFDTDKTQWQQYIRDNALYWIQHREEIPWNENTLASAYHVRWIPTLYLIDRDGRVVLGTVDVDTMGSRLKDLNLNGQ